MSHYSIEFRRDTQAEAIAQIEAEVTAKIQELPEHAPTKATVLAAVSQYLGLVADKPGTDYRVVVNSLFMQSEDGIDEIQLSVCVGLQMQGSPAV